MRCPPCAGSALTLSQKKSWCGCRQQQVVLRRYSSTDTWQRRQDLAEGNADSMHSHSRRSHLVLLPNLRTAHRRLISTQTVWSFIQQIRDADGAAARCTAAHLIAQHLQPLPVLDWQETDARDALLYALDHLRGQDDQLPGCCTRRCGVCCMLICAFDRALLPSSTASLSELGPHVIVCMSSSEAHQRVGFRPWSQESNVWLGRTKYGAPGLWPCRRTRRCWV